MDLPSLDDTTPIDQIDQESILPSDLLSVVFDYLVRRPIDVHRVANEFPEWIRKHAVQVERAMDQVDQDLHEQMCLIFSSDDYNIVLETSLHFNEIHLHPTCLLSHVLYYYKAGPKNEQSIQYLLDILSTQVEPLAKQFGYKLQGQIQGLVNCSDDPTYFRNVSIRWNDDGQVIQRTSVRKCSSQR